MKLLARTLATTATLLSISAAPAFAFTHHPATPAEIQQTDDLNAKSLENARGSQTPDMTPSTAAPSSATPGTMAPSMSTPNAPMPSPESAATNPSTMAPVSLSQLAPLPDSLSSATVTSQNGEAVGIVQKIVMGTDGKPAMVDVALATNKKVVAISANELSYDAGKNILVAALTTEQIKSLPAAVS